MTSEHVAPRRADTPRPDATVHVVALPDLPLADDLALLSDDELRRVGRFRMARDRSAFVTARATVRRRLGSILGTAPRRVPIVYETGGRPGLPADVGGAIDFNVSHSGSLAAVAVAEGRRVGVDVEWQRADRGLDRLVPDVMGRRESELLAGLEGEAYARAFYACWTRKEAIVKGLGVGISYPLREIDIPDLPAGGVVRVLDPDAARQATTWTLRTIELPGRYSLSVALAGADGTMSIVVEENVATRSERAAPLDLSGSCSSGPLARPE